MIQTSMSLNYEPSADRLWASNPEPCPKTLNSTPYTLNFTKGTTSRTLPRRQNLVGGHLFTKVLKILKMFPPRLAADPDPRNGLFKHVLRPSYSPLARRNFFFFIALEPSFEPSDCLGAFHQPSRLDQMVHFRCLIHPCSQANSPGFNLRSPLPWCKINF